MVEGRGVLRITYLFTVHGMAPGAGRRSRRSLNVRGTRSQFRRCPALTAATQAYAGSFGLADHISAVSTAIDEIPGRLILVAHSYAGMIARALESLRRDRLCPVSYFEAVVPEPGRSLLEMQPAGAAETLSALTRETPHGAVLALPNVARSASRSPTRNSPPRFSRS